MLYTKGAIDVLLDRSTHLLTGNGVVPMTPERRAEIEKVNRELSENGLRVLAFAQRPLPEARLLTLDDEKDYTFVGLISMIDPAPSREHQGGGRGQEGRHPHRHDHRRPQGHRHPPSPNRSASSRRATWRWTAWNWRTCPTPNWTRSCPTSRCMPGSAPSTRSAS